jgi:hypothetical protein
MRASELQLLFLSVSVSVYVSPFVKDLAETSSLGVADGSSSASGSSISGTTFKASTAPRCELSELEPRLPSQEIIYWLSGEKQRRAS